MKDKIDIDVLNLYKEDGKLRCSEHNELPLLIWNYHDRVQYTPELWDDITLNCRGLVTDTGGNIIARSFPKFFNMEEIEINHDKEFRTFEKLDGSLGILFNYNNEWIFSSRGSFHSEQAVKAMEIIKEKHPQFTKLDASFSYIFEIIYPQNRIVVNYGNSTRLIYLSKYNKSGTEYLDIESMKDKGFDVVNEILINTSFNELKNLNTANEEGFVIRFEDGQRMKIKFDDYIELHRIKTNVNVKLVLETYRDNNLIQIIDIIPDEFMDWFKLTYNHIERDFRSIKEDILYQYMKYKDRNPNCVKEFALSIVELPQVYKTIMFMLYRNIASIDDDRIRTIIIEKHIMNCAYEEYER